MEGHELPNVNWWCENCSTVFAHTNNPITKKRRKGQGAWAKPVARYFLGGGTGGCCKSTSADAADQSTAA